MYRQWSIDDAGDQGGAGEARALGAERVPNVCCHHAAFRELHVELLSDHVIALRRRLESSNAVNAELALKKFVEAGVLGWTWMDRWRVGKGDEAEAGGFQL